EVCVEFAGGADAVDVVGGEGIEREGRDIVVPADEGGLGRRREDGTVAQRPVLIARIAPAASGVRRGRDGGRRDRGRGNGRGRARGRWRAASARRTDARAGGEGERGWDQPGSTGGHRLLIDRVLALLEPDREGTGADLYDDRPCRSSRRSRVPTTASSTSGRSPSMPTACSSRSASWWRRGSPSGAGWRAASTARPSTTWPCGSSWAVSSAPACTT